MMGGAFVLALLLPSRGRNFAEELVLCTTARLLVRSKRAYGAMVRDVIMTFIDILSHF